MDLSIALILLQDAVVSGAVYTLLGLVFVLVFAVTRVIMIPQGEIVAFSALTFSTLQVQKVPGTVGLLAAAGVASFALGLYGAIRRRRYRQIVHDAIANLLLPGAIIAVVFWARDKNLPLPVLALLSVAVMAPLGPMLYRLAFQRIANASVLVLLVVAVAVHFALTGIGLVMFGAEGSRSKPFADHMFDIAGMVVPLQNAVIVAMAACLIVGLFLFFEHTLWGKALRATAVHRLGARLVGISQVFSGQAAFALASTIGAVSGVLLAPITTVYYDTGFIIGLKGLVAGIIGGMVSYPLAAAGAFLVGLLESFSSFQASSFKEVIIFTLIIPVLFWRSLATMFFEEEVEEL